MADDALLRRLGAAAIQKLPLPVQQTMRGVTFRAENGPTQSIASGSQRGNLAGIIPGQNVINIMDQAAFQKAPEQLAMHEAIHKWQDDLPPAIQAQIPPDDPNNPYQVWDTNRVAQLLAHGGTLANMPKEQASSTGQYYQAQGGDKSAPKAMRNTYGKLIETMPTVPQSVVMPTDPFQKGINTTLRPPRAPMMMSQQTYTKGQPAEPPPPPGYTVDSEPAPPAGYTLDAGPDAPPAIKPSIPVPQGLQGPPAPSPAQFGSSISDVFNTIAQHGKNMVAGPYHAFTDAPRNAGEQRIKSLPGNSGLFGQADLGAARMFAEPTIQNARESVAQYKAGNNEAGFQSAMDAVPVVGPWAKQIETDTQNKGAVAGMAGLATDIFAPKLAGKAVGMGLQATGRATQLASTSPASLKLATTRAIVPGPPEAMLMRALKPSVAYPDAQGLFGRRLPDVINQNPNIKTVSDFANAADSAAGAKNAQYRGLLDPHINEPVDVQPLVDAQNSSVPFIAKTENPGIIGSTQNVAARYAPKPETTETVTSPLVDEFGGPITRKVTTPAESPKTLGFADQVRRDSNRVLHSYLSDTPEDRYAARVRPDVARMDALNNASRDLTYGKLSDLTGTPEEDIRDTQHAYGDLQDIGDIAGKRNIVASRANPMSLSEQIASGSGGIKDRLTGYVTERLLKDATSSDSITQAAIDRFKNPKMRLQPYANPFARATMGTGRNLAGIGTAIQRAPLVKNPLFLLNRPNQSQK